MTPVRPGLEPAETIEPGRRVLEVDRRNDRRVVRARLALPCVRVVLDRGHPGCCGDGGDVGGVCFGDEVVADEDVVDQFGSAARRVVAGESLGEVDCWCPAVVALITSAE